MNNSLITVTAALVAPIFAMIPAIAAKTHESGNGHGKGNSAKAAHSQKFDKSDKNGGEYRGKLEADDSRGHRYSDGDQRNIIHDYYANEFKSGHCPPGLAKKNNGCLPPGQAKKWQLGHRLPDDVIYHDLPGDLLRRLGHNDPAYKLIRVGSDILKIGVGSGLVVEAVDDLGDLF